MFIYEYKDRYIDEYEGRKRMFNEELEGEQKALNEVKIISYILKEKGKMRRNLSGYLRKSAIMPKSIYNLNENLIKSEKKHYNENYNNVKKIEKKILFDTNEANKKTKNNSVNISKINSNQSKIYSMANQDIIKKSPKRVKFNENKNPNINKNNCKNFNTFHEKNRNLQNLKHSMMSTSSKKSGIKEIIEEKDDEQEETEENLKNNMKMINSNEILKKTIENKLQKDEFEKDIPVKQRRRFHCSCELKKNEISDNTFNIETNKNNNNIKKNNLNSFLFSKHKKENSNEINFRKKPESGERNFLHNNIKQNKRYDIHRNASEIYERDNKIENKSPKYKFENMMQKRKQKEKKNNENNSLKSASPFTRKYNNYFSNSTYKRSTEIKNNENSLQKENKEEGDHLFRNKLSSCKKNLSNSSIFKGSIDLQYGSVRSNERESKEFESDERTKDKSNDNVNNLKKEEISYFTNNNGFNESYYYINEDNKTISDINFYKSSIIEKSYEDKNKKDKQYMIRLIIRK